MKHPVARSKPSRDLYWVAAALLLVAPLPQGRTAEPLQWTKHSGFKTAAIVPPQESAPGFTLVPANEAGIRFKNELSNQRSLERRGLLSGSGVAAGDVDGDGWCDLYFCGLDNSNTLYRNLGNWQFEEIPPTGGIECARTDATAAAFADLDGDHDLDLLVAASGNGVRLFTNDGKGQFRETTREANLASQLGSMSLALADVDSDGDLDLYVANFRPTTIMDEASTRFQGRNINGVPTVTHVNGQPTTLPLYTNRFIISPTNKILELGQEDQLLLNDGKGHFTEVSFTAGRFLDEEGQRLDSPPRDWGLAVQMRDFTGDGAPDIYVCNDLYTPDRIWINQGNGTFRALATLALRNTSTFSMGVDFADIERDGDMDFFVVDMLSPDHRKRHVQVNMSPPRPNAVGLNENRQQILRNTLQLNLGDNTFSEISLYSGLAATDWSWGPIFLDVDLDGYEDILVTNGQLRDFQNVDHARRLESIRQQRKVSIKEFRELINQYPNLATPNFAFQNKGDLSFQDRSKAWGFDQHGISQGMALADLDNDGDMDVIQNNLHESPHLLRNNASSPRIRIQLAGRAPNTQGIGAQITVEGGPVSQSQEILAGGRYLSSDQPARTFAARSDNKPVGIQVRWRSGNVTSIKDVDANTLCLIEELPGATHDSPPEKPNASTSQIAFADISSQLNHRHQDEPFNDLERQPLLPNRLSQWGPPLAWTDLDGDGWDDLIIGAGRGGALAAYRNQSGSSFQRIEKRLTKIPSSRDHTSILPWSHGGRQLLVGMSNYEDGVVAGDAISLMQWDRDRVSSLVNAREFSFGTLTAADLDSDGDLDLFVAGRVQPGRYPEPVDSFLLENDEGRLKPAFSFPQLGMVTGAVFSDIDADGKPELIVSREWDSIKVFSGNLQSMTDVTEKWQLHTLSGWWNGIAAGDFNGDGKMDLVATNWGHNHKFPVRPESPLKLYYADLDQNGIVDMVESYIDAGTDQELPIRSLRTVGLAIPSIRQRIRSFENYAQATLSDIYGELLNRAVVKTANHLAHTVWINQGDHFVSHTLPLTAQLAPAFGIAIADFDSDGNEDLFLSQNFFATSPGTHRYDAGRGLVLQGRGDGHFDPISHHQSGITIYGEQRAAAVADFNHDGKPDLAVSQNGASTKLFRNVAQDRGLRVTLTGPRGNEAAIGSQLRIFGAKGAGPIREIHATSGWLSVDSRVAILARPQSPKELWVRWPDGHETRTPIPANATSLRVGSDGQLIP